MSVVLGSSDQVGWVEGRTEVGEKVVVVEGYGNLKVQGNLLNNILASTVTIYSNSLSLLPPFGLYG